MHKNDYETLSRFRYQLRRFVRWSEEITCHHGLTNLQYLLLLHIRGFPGREWATISELAERLQAKHHGVVSLVSRCQQRGLVERRPGRTDGREVEVHLTPAGQQKIAQLAALHRGELVRLQGILSVPGESEFTGERAEKPLDTAQTAASTRE